MGQKQSTIEDTAFELKLKAKGLERASKRATKESKQEALKVKKMLQQGEREPARIYARNVKNKESEALQLLQMSARFDAIGSRLKTAATQGDLQKMLAPINSQVTQQLLSMPLEAMTQNVDQFEKMCEDLDVKAEYLQNSLDNTTATTTPEEEVDGVLRAIGEEAALDVGAFLSVDVPAGQVAQEATAAPVQDDMQARLAALRQG